MLNKILKISILFLAIVLVAWGVLSLIVSSGSKTDSPDSSGVQAGTVITDVPGKITDKPENTPNIDPNPTPTVEPPANTPEVTPTPSQSVAPQVTPSPEPSATTSPAPTQLVPKPDGKYVVVLDPGHGGYDPGAVVGDYLEKDITLPIALKVRDLLEKHENITVYMTREEDVFVSLEKRGEFANSHQADIFISIHANIYEASPTAKGTISFYHPDKPANKKTALTMQSAIVSVTGSRDRGAQTGKYAVLSIAQMPAALIETGFMSCPEELAKLIDPEYQQLMAQGISNGILNFLKAN